MDPEELVSMLYHEIVKLAEHGFRTYRILLPEALYDVWQYVDKNWHRMFKTMQVEIVYDGEVLKPEYIYK